MYDDTGVERHPAAAMEADFVAGMNSGDVDRMTLHRRVRVRPLPGQPLARGRGAIREAMAGFLSGNPRLEVRTVKVVPSTDGETALMWLSWALETTAEDGTRSVIVGRVTKGRPKGLRRPLISLIAVVAFGDVEVLGDSTEIMHLDRENLAAIPHGRSALPVSTLVRTGDSGR